MILDSSENDLFLGKKNRASRQERKETRKQIRQERKEVRKEARQLRRSGQKTEAKALRKNFRATAKNLRREKGMGLLGAIGIRKPQTSADLAEPQNTQSNEAQEQNLNAGALAATSQDATQFSEPRTTGGSIDTSGGGFSAGTSGGSQDTGQDSGQDDDEGTDENGSEKPKKKSKKWLWIGGGIALLVIAVVLFLVLRNKE